MHQLLQKEPDIINWLDEHLILDYILRPDPEYGFKVDVTSAVGLSQMNLEAISVKFGDVKTFFDCSCNQLTSLYGAPDTVGSSFYCTGNYIASLEHLPKNIGRNLHCQNNRLTSLSGAPKFIKGTLDCSNNLLTSLEGAPGAIGESFFCKSNALTNLNHAPLLVYDNYDCSANKLVELTNLPKSLKGRFICRDNPELGYLQGDYQMEELREILRIQKEKDLLTVKVDSAALSKLQKL